MVSSSDDYSDLAEQMPVDVYGPTSTPGRRQAAIPAPRQKSTGGTFGWVFVVLALLVGVPSLGIGALLAEPISIMCGTLVLSIIGGSLIVRAAILERD